MAVLQRYGFDGVDLDVEETMPLEDVKYLISRLKRNLGGDFIVTLAPVYSPMVSARPSRRQVNESRTDIDSNKDIDLAPDITMTSSLPMAPDTASKSSTDAMNDEFQDADASPMKEQLDPIDSFSQEDTCPAPRSKRVQSQHPSPSSNSPYQHICSRKRAIMYHANGARKRNLSGFNYADLRESPAGRLVDWYNVQCYCGWGQASADSLKRMVQNGWRPSQIVVGTVTNAAACAGYVGLADMRRQIHSMARLYPDFGGIVGWEYFNGPGKFHDNPTGSNTHWPSRIGRFIDEGLRMH